MKKLIAWSLALLLVFVMASCSEKSDIKQTVQGNQKTYYEMSDGTWQCEGHFYQYRLEIKGRLNAAAQDSEFVYLSNREEITFDQAWKACGLSSDLNDYFSVEDAVLVELK